MNSYLAICSPNWRDSPVTCFTLTFISPNTRQSGEIKKLNINTLTELIDEGITEGVIEGITEGVKESMVQIVSVILTEQSVRASEIAKS